MTRPYEIWGPVHRVDESTSWRTQIQAVHREHPGLIIGCVDCRADTGGWCGRPEHEPFIYRDPVAANLVVDVGLNFLRDVLETTSPSAGIRYMAWGSDSTAPVAGNTTLGTEDGRKQITSFSSPSVGVKKSITYLAPNDANQTLEELGWFATSTATSTVDSGVMLGRVLYPGGAHPKTNLESIQLERTDTIS